MSRLTPSNLIDSIVPPEKGTFLPRSFISLVVHLDSFHDKVNTALAPNTLPLLIGFTLSCQSYYI